STGTTSTPAARAASAWRPETAASTRTPPAAARTASQSIDPSGMTSTPAVPRRGAASQASARSPDAALVGTIDVKAVAFRAERSPRAGTRSTPEAEGVAPYPAAARGGDEGRRHGGNPPLTKGGPGGVPMRIKNPPASPPSQGETTRPPSTGSTS